MITYLTKWRLSLSTDLITDPDATVTNVAHQVGKSSPFALSAAFKRRYGLSPHQYRTATLNAPGGDEHHPLQPQTDRQASVVTSP